MYQEDLDVMGPKVLLGDQEGPGPRVLQENPDAKALPVHQENQEDRDSKAIQVHPENQDCLAPQGNHTSQRILRVILPLPTQLLGETAGAPATAGDATGAANSNGTYPLHFSKSIIAEIQHSSVD